MTDIEIEVDGLLAPVDAYEYESDPDGVVAQVREARVALRLGDDVPEAEDYDALMRSDR